MMPDDLNTGDGVQLPRRRLPLSSPPKRSVLGLRGGVGRPVHPSARHVSPPPGRDLAGQLYCPCPVSVTSSTRDPLEDRAALWR